MADVGYGLSLEREDLTGRRDDECHSLSAAGPELVVPIYFFHFTPLFYLLFLFSAYRHSGSIDPKCDKSRTSS